MEKAKLKNILIVDDDELFQRSLRNILKNKYQVQGAESAERAMGLLKSQPPDLIILDITLPGMDGITFLEKIKSSRPNLPVIMLSAVDRIPKVVESIKLGAFDYLTKPMNIEELFQAIDRALERSKSKKKGK